MKENNLITELDKYASDADAVFLQRFFKTGPGEYGEGDIFIGVRMPNIRLVCKRFDSLSLDQVTKLLDSKIHEHRMAGLIIICNKYKHSEEYEKQKLYSAYLSALKRQRINNWDLIDVTCPHVMGEYLLNNPRDIIYELAKSNSLWERRASVLTTFTFIKHGQVADSLRVAELLLNDKQDLIHKAVGWMLREIGKQVDESILTDFLDTHVHEMPRTMLRYSIEHLPETSRKYYLNI